MPPKDMVVYFNKNDSKVINKRLYGIKKFIQEILLNEDLNDSADLHTFLQDDDCKYETYKKQLEEKLRDPLNL
jgi:hypothetical protein